MTYTDSTQRDFIRQIVRNQTQNSIFARVQKVKTHTSDDDYSNFEVDVTIPGDIDDSGHIAVPVVNHHSDGIEIPEVGDKVIIHYIDGDKENPIAAGILSTNKDRPPKGEAGMWRQRAISDTSPTGSGDLYTTTHTRYNKNPAREDPSGLTVTESFSRIAKKDDANDYPVDTDIPMMIEMYDSPENDESRISLEGNVVDGDTSKSMNVTLDMKAGTLVLEVDDGGTTHKIELDVNNNTATFSGDGSQEMGLSLDFDGDGFKVLDGNGYGVESDGSGNLTFWHETISYVESSTTL